MIISNYYKHIEYQYPEAHFRGFWSRIVILVISYSLVISIFEYLFHLVKSDENNIALIFIAFILGPFSFFGLLWLTADFIRFFTSPSKSYKVMSKIVLTHEGIAVRVRNYTMKQLKWKDIEIIEKMRVSGERKLILITNPMKERVIICEEKKKNFIKTHPRPSGQEILKTRDYHF